MRPKVYLASGWFNPEQKKQMLEVYNVLRNLEVRAEIDLFAPYFDGIVLKPTDPEIKKKMRLVWWLDIEQIKCSDLLVACTQDHDVGTIFECGYASAKGKTIICYNSKEELGLNVMLAQEAKGFCKSDEQLLDALLSFIRRWWEVRQGMKQVDEWRFNIWEGEPI